MALEADVFRIHSTCDLAIRESVSAKPIRESKSPVVEPVHSVWPKLRP